MDCQPTRDWLLQADDPRPEQCASADVADHLAACSTCQSLSADLVQLQDAWRSIPLPASADDSRQVFLSRLPRLTLPLDRPRRRAWTLPRWVAAAVVLLGIGLSAWFLFATPEAHAEPVVIERLVDWNLEMARATPAERGQLYTAREAALKAEVDRAPLGEADRELAHLLLENGSWLASNDDPMDAAERFSTVADKLVERMQTASERKEIQLANRYARLQALVAEHGVEGNLKKAEESGALNFAHPGRLEKIILRDRERRDTLIQLLESNPNLSRKDIRKALDIPPKTPKSTMPGAKSNSPATNPPGGSTLP